MLYFLSPGFSCENPYIWLSRPKRLKIMLQNCIATCILLLVRLSILRKQRASVYKRTTNKTWHFPIIKRWSVWPRMNIADRHNIFWSLGDECMWIRMNIADRHDTFQSLRDEVWTHMNIWAQALMLVPPPPPTPPPPQQPSVIVSEVHELY